VGTTHEGHLVVFITVQNLVGIDVVVWIVFVGVVNCHFQLTKPVAVNTGLALPRSL